VRRTILVTGAGGGLGGETARLFAERGWTVFAADLTPPPAGAHVVPVVMDVTDTATVEKALAKVEEASPDGLGAVVNFAGILAVGPLVEIEEARLQRVLDINVMGTYRVNKAAFDAVRRGGGRIVNISSETGWQRAMMLNGPYAMSKHAIEAYSDALRRELMFLGVPVVVIQPGPFRTNMTGSVQQQFARAVGEDSPFARLVAKVGRAGARESAKSHDPAELAEVIWTAVTTDRPKLRYSVKPDRQRVRLHRLPTRLADRLLLKSLR